MQSKAGWLFGLASLGVLAICVQSATLAQGGSAGRDLFVDYGCWQCHGYEGQGTAAGPRLAPTLLPYVAFAQLVRRPADAMPAYAPSTLSDDVLQEIFAYLGSIAEPPALEDIPELR